MKDTQFVLALFIGSNLVSAPFNLITRRLAVFARFRGHINIISVAVRKLEGSATFFFNFCFTVALVNWKFYRLCVPVKGEIIPTKWDWGLNIKMMLNFNKHWGGEFVDVKGPQEQIRLICVFQIQI